MADLAQFGSNVQPNSGIPWLGGCPNRGSRIKQISLISPRFEPMQSPSLCYDKTSVINRLAALKL